MKWGWTQKTTKGHSLFSDEQKKIQSIETQTFVKLLFWQPQASALSQCQGHLKLTTANAELVLGAPRKSPRDRHTPVWALVVWLLGQRKTKGHILFCLNLLTPQKTRRKQRIHLLINTFMMMSPTSITQKTKNAHLFVNLCSKKRTKFWCWTISTRRMKSIKN